MDRNAIVDRLKTVPGNYDDFINDTADWMLRDERIEKAVLDQLTNKPDSDTDDITLVLWKCLGIGTPLELIDDEDRPKPKRSMKKKIAAF